MQKLTQQDGTTLLVSDEQLQEIINAQPKKIESSIGWTLEIDEIYFYKTPEGRVFWSGFVNDHIDNARISLGNCYKTEAEAQKVLDKQKALRRIHVYMRENGLVFDDVDFEDGTQKKWQITGWDYELKGVESDTYSLVNASKGDLYFRLFNDLYQIQNNCKEDLEIFLK
jgi:hypothetical protein